jgi:hypothetical protein
MWKKKWRREKNEKVRVLGRRGGGKGREKRVI